jgi:hypothetical protein
MNSIIRNKTWLSTAFAACLTACIGGEQHQLAAELGNQALSAES